MKVASSPLRETERKKARPYRIDPRWVAAGIVVTTVLASADVGKTWYWFPERIPVSTFVYSVAIWSVYSAWVVIGGFIGWFRLRLSERQLRPAVEWSLHGIASVTVGLVHLAANAGLVWLMYSPSVPNLSATTIYLEKLIAWLPFEILAYWGCLAVFTLLAQRRDSLQVADAPAYQQRLSARSGDETVVVHCSDIDWIVSLTTCRWPRACTST